MLSPNPFGCLRFRCRRFSYFITKKYVVAKSVPVPVFSVFIQDQTENITNPSHTSPVLTPLMIDIDILYIHMDVKGIIHIHMDVKGIIDQTCYYYHCFLLIFVLPVRVCVPVTVAAAVLITNK